jgi:hypothetical protein
MSNIKAPFLKYLGRNTDGSREYSIAAAAGDDFSECVVRVDARIPETDLEQHPTITSTSGNISPGIRAVIENFDKAGHIMMFEHGRVAASAPYVVPQKMRPIELVALAKNKSGKYPFEVTIETASGNKKYIFDITPEPTPGICWEKKFVTDMGGSTHLATPLLDAIVGFFEVNN